MELCGIPLVTWDVTVASVQAWVLATIFWGCVTQYPEAIEAHTTRTGLCWGGAVGCWWYILFWLVVNFRWGGGAPFRVE